MVTTVPHIEKPDQVNLVTQGRLVKGDTPFLRKKECGNEIIQTGLNPLVRSKITFRIAAHRSGAAKEHLFLGKQALRGKLPRHVPDRFGLPRHFLITRQ
ncbi:MAG: hypothetical protein BWY49_00275 [Candidatus Omnitrophica bacterium ADurb.Bin314]|nr:MAG: hypothetical protein BWY49_00275 [Candidatus Omnitrophica bacterium ADurb.Bin314]